MCLYVTCCCIIGCNESGTCSNSMTDNEEVHISNKKSCKTKRGMHDTQCHVHVHALLKCSDNTENIEIVW